MPTEHIAEPTRRTPRLVRTELVQDVDHPAVMTGHGAARCAAALPEGGRAVTSWCTELLLLVPPFLVPEMQWPAHPAVSSSLGCGHVVHGDSAVMTAHEHPRADSR